MVSFHFLSFSLRDIVDLTIVYLIVFQVLTLLKRSRSFSLIPLLLFVLVIYVLARVWQLTTLTWMLQCFSTGILVLMILVFQPEIRRLLEKLGQDQQFGLETFRGVPIPRLVKHLLVAVDLLSKQKIGALIVVEGQNPLDEYARSGILMESLVSSDLLVNLFWPNTPTHDGAIILRQNRVLAASCLLPLTDSRLVDRRLGTRHRAAIGLTEHTDAVVIVISEETGTISLAERGSLTRFLNKEALETRLFELFGGS
jgi:diadenylate cyclase